MSKRTITLTVYDGMPVQKALSELAEWFSDHEADPEKVPMTGVVVCRGCWVLGKSDYSKDGYFFHKDEPSKKAQK